jgi:hypothetical protein
MPFFGCVFAFLANRWALSCTTTGCGGRVSSSEQGLRLQAFGAERPHESFVLFHNFYGFFFIF